MSENRKALPAWAKEIESAAKSLSEAGSPGQAEAALARIMELAGLRHGVAEDSAAEVRPWAGIH